MNEQTITVQDANKGDDYQENKLSSESFNNDKIVNRLADFKVDAILWYFALPSIIANAVSAITNTIQTNIQKSYMGDVGISATGIVQPLELVLTMYISLGLSGGLCTFLSPALGRKDFPQAQKYLMHFMVLYLIVVILVPACTLPWMNTLVVRLGAEKGSEMAKYAAQYGYVIFGCATVFYFINYGYGNILRATSRSIFNNVKQIFTALIELLCVYLFFRFYVSKGHVQLYTIAAAPVIANAICAVPVISLFIPKIFRTFKLKFSTAPLKKFDFNVTLELLYLSIPDFLVQIQIPVQILVGNAVLKRISSSYMQLNTWVTNLSIVYKMSPLIDLSNKSFSAAFSPTFGYALGAKNWARVREIMRRIVIWQTGLSMLFFIVMNIAITAICAALMKGYTPMEDDCNFGFRCYNACMPLLTCFYCSKDINKMEQRPMKAILIQLTRLFMAIAFEVAMGLALNNQKGIYYGVMMADLGASIVGWINFAQRYKVYGQLERNEITMKQAKIHDPNNKIARCGRKVERTETERRDIQITDAIAV
ncbi:Na+_driven multidrug efflux pump [Hexamita inflata]|uniref:Na+ driven multidrug efflux pump n=1 Tax=Hexamita inflata TaxID=28002 RepID=A0AA86QKR5_9EUKA|nr:Na+ driven multidrug efflux pump [Hexamita inflata]